MRQRAFVPAWGLVFVGIAAAVIATGCEDELGPPLCSTTAVTLPASPLTLLADARLDRVADAFVLLGADGNTVRWMALTPAGQPGASGMFSIPDDHVGGPWFGVAGGNVPGDSVVIAYTVGSPPGAPAGALTLVAVSVPFAGGAPAPEPRILGTVPDSRVRAVQTVMTSGRAGRHAAIAWGEVGGPPISVLVLGGDAQPLAPALDLEAGITFDCLRFSPGKDDFTVGYVDLSATPPSPHLVFREIDGAGNPGGSVSIGLGDETPGCVDIAPSAVGYGFAWHNDIGTYLGVYDVNADRLVSQLVVGDVRIAGRPPVLSGLGWTGRDYGLVVDRENGGELWRVDAYGDRRGGASVFPSTRGRIGQLSSQPAGPLMHVTYADYSSADPTNRSAGQRFFVTATCP